MGEGMDGIDNNGNMEPGFHWSAGDDKSGLNPFLMTALEDLRNVMVNTSSALGGWDKVEEYWVWILNPWTVRAMSLSAGSFFTLDMLVEDGVFKVAVVVIEDPHGQVHHEAIVCYPWSYYQRMMLAMNTHIQMEHPEDYEEHKELGRKILEGFKDKHGWPLEDWWSEVWGD